MFEISDLITTDFSIFTLADGVTTFGGYIVRSYNDASFGGVSVGGSDLVILCRTGSVELSISKNDELSYDGKTYLVYRESHRPNNINILKIYIREVL